MAKLFDKLMNRVIKGKLTIEDSDELSKILKDAVESAEKSEPIVFDATEQHHTQAQLKEAISHKVLKLGENLFYRIAYSDYYVSYIYVNVLDDGVANGDIKSLTFAIDTDDSSVSEPDLYQYTFGELVNFTDTDLVAKTLKQTQPNWESNIEIESHTGGDDYQVALTYGKCVLLGNELHIVAIVKATNNSSASISHPHIIFKKIDVPSNLQSKIFDMDGKSLDETALTTYCPITSSTRCGRGNLTDWTSRFSNLDAVNGKLFRSLDGHNMSFEVREGLPTLDAGETGYLLVGFDLLII